MKIEDTIVINTSTGKQYFADERTAKIKEDKGTHKIVAHQKDGSYKRLLAEQKKQEYLKNVEQHNKRIEGRKEEILDRVRSGNKIYCFK